MKEGYAAARCERCGNESQLMMQSMHSNLFLCPACLENELKYELAEPAPRIYQEDGDTNYDLYPYVADPVVSTKN